MRDSGVKPDQTSTANSQNLNFTLRNWFGNIHTSRSYLDPLWTSQ